MTGIYLWKYSVEIFCGNFLQEFLWKFGGSFRPANKSDSADGTCYNKEADTAAAQNFPTRKGGPICETLNAPGEATGS
jgi:hypothetical protein